GYSTATAPWTDAASKSDPVDQSVCLVTREGRSTHRAGWRTLDVRVDPGPDAVGVASSVAEAHLLTPGPPARDHASGLRGTAHRLATMTVASLVRGPWETRLVRVDELADGVAATDLVLRVGGWPVVDDDGLVSAVTPLGTAARTGTARRADASL